MHWKYVYIELESEEKKKQLWFSVIIHNRMEEKKALVNIDDDDDVEQKGDNSLSFHSYSLYLSLLLEAFFFIHYNFFYFFCLDMEIRYFSIEHIFKLFSF